MPGHATPINRRALIEAILFCVAEIGVSAVAGWMLNLPVAWVLVIGLMVVIAGLVYFIQTRGLVGAGDGLRSLGVREVRAMVPAIDEKRVDDAMTSLFFWSLSGGRTLKTITSAITRVGKARGEIRILLLAPDSPHMERRAKQEGENLLACQKDIEATVQRLRSLAEREHIEIQIRYYDEPPIWRLLIIDKTTFYVNYFLPTKKGSDSPHLVVSMTNEGLAKPLMDSFERCWNSAKDASPRDPR